MSITLNGDDGASLKRKFPSPDRNGDARSPDRRKACAIDNIRRHLRAYRAAVATLDCELVEVTACGRLRGATVRARAWLAATGNGQVGKPVGSTGGGGEAGSFMPSQSAADETQAILIWRVGVAGRNYLLLERRRGMITIPGLRALGLREREPEVMVWVAAGKRNRDIGVILDMSERTVGKHVENILAKLGVESRMAATHYVIRAMHARARIGPAAL